MSEIFGFHFNERVNWARKINFFTNMAPYYLKKKKKRKEMWLREITIKTDFYNSAKYGGHLRFFFSFDDSIAAARGFRCDWKLCSFTSNFISTEKVDE
jgi:hypothetical protein